MLFTKNTVVKDWHCVSSIFREIFCGSSPYILVLIRLWRTIHYSSQNSFTLKEILAVYGMKTLKVAKGTVTRRLSPVAACKRCHERYNAIMEALDSITENL